jgi:hypothetical protein
MSDAPVRLERDGGVASLVLHDPPLNLFGPHTYEALMACLEEVEGSDARALVWRAEGEAFTGGADVNVFNRVVEALESGSGTHEIAGFGQVLKKLRQQPKQKSRIYLWRTDQLIGGEQIENALAAQRLHKIVKLYGRFAKKVLGTLLIELQ